MSTTSIRDEVTSAEPDSLSPRQARQRFEALTVLSGQVKEFRHACCAVHSTRVGQSQQMSTESDAKDDMADAVSQAERDKRYLPELVVTCKQSELGASALLKGSARLSEVLANIVQSRVLEVETLRETDAYLNASLRIAAATAAAVDAAFLEERKERRLETAAIARHVPDL